VKTRTSGRTSLLSAQKSHPARDLQTFDDPRVDSLIDQCRTRRVLSKISQKDIAELSSCTRRAIVFMENHQHMPSLSLFVRYANACGFVLVLSEFRA
jgi:DNA-binding XRE family transcriptional regulator